MVCPHGYQCEHFADKAGEGQFCADVFYGRSKFVVLLKIERTCNRKTNDASVSQSDYKISIKSFAVDGKLKKQTRENVNFFFFEKIANNIINSEASLLTRMAPTS